MNRRAGETVPRAYRVAGAWVCEVNVRQWGSYEPGKEDPVCQGRQFGLYWWRIKMSFQKLVLAAGVGGCLTTRAHHKWNKHGCHHDVLWCLFASLVAMLSSSEDCKLQTCVLAPFRVLRVQLLLSRQNCLSIQTKMSSCFPPMQQPSAKTLRSELRLRQGKYFFFFV